MMCQLFRELFVSFGSVVSRSWRIAAKCGRKWLLFFFQEENELLLKPCAFGMVYFRGPNNWVTYIYRNKSRVNLTFGYPCIASIIVNDDQQDANILAYLFIPNQLYMSRAIFSPIIRSTWLYLQLLILSIDTAAGWFHGFAWYQPAAVSVDNIRSCKYCFWWWAKTSPPKHVKLINL